MENLKGFCNTFQTTELALKNNLFILFNFSIKIFHVNVLVNVYLQIFILRNLKLNS